VVQKAPSLALTQPCSLSWQDAELLDAIAARQTCPPAAAAQGLAHTLAAARPRHAIGLAIFLLGSFQQARCHGILRSMRQTPATGTHRYSIPRGGWFEMVSSAHYLAEIVLYAGLLAACGLNCMMVCVP